MLVAAVCIVAFPLILALLGFGSIATDLQIGFTEFIFGAMAVPALFIGALYACLYIFGSRIYLDHRENTFCIPVNRCSSLLAGVVAAFLLSVFYEGTFVGSTQLISSAILITAILFLSVPFFEERLQSFSPLLGFGKGAENRKKVIHYLFVCPGNTSRSPMAQAICTAQLKTTLLQQGKRWNEDYIKVSSAGIDANVGAPMSGNANKTVLEKIGIKPLEHKANNLTEELVAAATNIFCMSEEHRKIIVKKFPEATTKIEHLDPKGSVTIPHGRDIEAYMQCAKSLKKLIDIRIVGS